MSDEPVWLQEWSEKYGTIVMPDGKLALEHALDHGQSDELTRLLVAAPALVRALLAVEWVPMTMLAYPSIMACAKCTEMRRLGHKPTCSTDAALSAAGFPDQASRDAARERMAEK
jgi:hypothetical protein